ncbi:MAG TPA: ceramidase domain-containing protein [Blastocatellia bacterium]|nr:ceramidase domain-containing protein [Blastocatellia bacterium]
MEHLHRQSLAPEDRTVRIWGLVIATLLAVSAVACLPAIPQAAHFHHFADQRSWWGIPNLLNVVSNITFVAGGMAGLVFLWRRSNEQLAKAPWSMFFVGAVLTGIGSAYYHLAPDNARLVWDRLPMTIVFMSLLAAIITERISEKGGRVLLLPLLLLGVGSVVYWHFTEQAGQGDLRLYGFVQFYLMLLIPAILLLFPARYTKSYYLFGMIGVYVLAKMSEHFDAELLALGEVVSGHTVKHLIASLPIWFVLQMLQTRKAI